MNPWVDIMFGEVLEKDFASVLQVEKEREVCGSRGSQNLYHFIINTAGDQEPPG